MAHSIIGFHYSVGGNKTGIGAFMDKLNAAGIPFLMKGTDDAGLCFEGQQKGQTNGVNNYLIYRVSTDGQDNGISYDVPNYVISPADAAQDHFNKTAAKWPAELNKSIVWMEPINEPRAKLNPGDIQWNNMHPVDWLGFFMYEYAKLANAKGFKVCGPSFNSGEPKVFTTNDYEQPGMLAYLQYCADNPDKAALSIHEYTWDGWEQGQGWPDWYPNLWGRVEAAIAAADKNNIPRAFSIFVTEWGFAYQNAPRWPECEPYLTGYNEWAARFPQVKGAAAWTVGSGWGDVDDDLQTWFGPLGDYAVNTIFDEGPQPAATHAAFGGTLPTDEPEEPTMQKYSFESDNWTVLSDRLQQPENMTLQVIDPGAPLWYPGGDTGGKATGTVEALHKGCNFNPPNLPPHQCADGSDPLVLDGFRCYKIQAVDMASGTSLKYTFQGTGRKRVTVPLNVHWQGDSPNEADDVYAAVIMNGQTVKLLQHPELKDRTWHYVVGEFEAPVTVELRFQTSYRNRRDCFTDFWTAEDINPMDWKQQLWDIAKARQLVAFNPRAALQAKMVEHGFNVAETEFDYTRPDGTPLKAQLAIHPGDARRRVYYAVVPNWSDVQWYSIPPEDEPDTPFTTPQ